MGRCLRGQKPATTPGTSPYPLREKKGEEEEAAELEEEAELEAGYVELEVGMEEEEAEEEAAEGGAVPEWEVHNGAGLAEEMARERETDSETD